MYCYSVVLFPLASTGTDGTDDDTVQTLTGSEEISEDLNSTLVAVEEDTVDPTASTQHSKVDQVQTQTPSHTQQHVPQMSSVPTGDDDKVSLRQFPYDPMCWSMYVHMYIHVHNMCMYFPKLHMRLIVVWRSSCIALHLHGCLKWCSKQGCSHFPTYFSFYQQSPHMLRAYD